MKKFDIYQVITVILSVAIIVSIGVFIYNLSFGGFGKAALSVDVQNGKAAVIINGKDKGETPVYTEELNAKNINVQINGEASSYSTIIKPSAGTLAVIKRELGVGGAFGSGLNIWFIKGSADDSSISVISPDTDGVSVIVDGVEMGKTPIKFSTNDLLKQSDEGKYVITFKKDKYQDQEVEVKVKPGYELNIRTDMFLKPMSAELVSLTGFDEGIRFVGFKGMTDAAFADRKVWAKAASYWISAHGSIIFDGNKIEKFDYFISDDGKIYNAEANEISADDLKAESGNVIMYLGSSSDSNISDSAKASIEASTGKVVASGANGKIKIKPTGIGYLKVRSSNSTGSTQLGKVDEGATFDVIEVKSGWYKIAYETGKEGWVSGTYVESVN
ncbi:hypothetical protein CO058_03440 [candidate division WWE3 bacterium CG_4_9_14_0_2_um_filter_35_11]|uniref:SH3b domain-containing protein n=1 Tax=candidate division WWE3 bacterium CG_4_9_14_0_2_um_filter_35_11 TaxID=1975077 RepID=A0A2M8EL81_UNCKA|nr:MAG: hypothetical protein COV25_00835 [candidate division WWE3 bacterium CG10_big_fil_rev_8_21_14_0_10_35_32]PJC23460.1 MAG: hypothetical protein CO058_03440 [candidate division WWE3 bacterium CG_4_9_14_0_2_um_filter_35_11]